MLIDKLIIMVKEAIEMLVRERQCRCGKNPNCNKCNGYGTVIMAIPIHPLASILRKIISL